MDLLVICLSSAMASALTMFSGFGLGTLLMPVFALFFPLPLAIALTAVVHFANNLFKLILLGKYANREIVIKFGVPAIGTAVLGAFCLNWFSGIPPIWTYTLGAKVAEITGLKISIGMMLIIFAVMDLYPVLNRFMQKQNFILGGAVSGFFGGLSGHQGALRSAFLIRCNLSKEAYIATGVVIACMVDIGRMCVYGTQLLDEVRGSSLNILIAAVLSAFFGVILANLFIKKTTLNFIQMLVAGLLGLIALGLMTGLI